jgi:threonine synthase
VLFWLEIMRRLGRGLDGPLAIASCGNAALAAAVVARAARRALSVFVPPHADPRVLEALARHGARIEPCPRVPGEAGDPCVRRFREAVAAGALPFTVQGSANGLCVEGGQTLAYEMSRAAPTDVVVQVGGGALAAAVARGFREVADLGLAPRPPRLHTVQTEGAWPLYRGWSRVAARLVDGGGAPAVPERPDAAAALAVASWIAERVPTERVGEAMTWARRHRSRVMWPWETEPRSVAGGILDDETYDWAEVVEAMLRTGGVPLVVPEADLVAAREAAQEAGYRVDATGAAGLAGVAPLARVGAFGSESRVAVLFTGAER